MAVAIAAAKPRSERIPSRALGEFEIAEIGAEAKTDAGADRHQYDIIGGQCGHAEAADKIGGTVDAAEPIEDRGGLGQIVDQHHGPCAVGAGVEADAWTLPEYAQIAGVFGVKRAVAVAKAADKGAAGFLAQNIAVRLPPLAAGFLHDHSKPA